MTEPVITTAFDVKAACVEALKTAMPDRQVDYGWPGARKKNEGIFLGTITWTDSDWESLGDPGGVNSREETYDIDMLIGVRKDGGTQQDATERAAAILTEAAQVLMENKTLVPHPGSLIVKPRISREPPGDNARFGDINAAIHVYAYLP